MPEESAGRKQYRTFDGPPKEPSPALGVFLPYGLFLVFPFVVFLVFLAVSDDAQRHEVVRHTQRAGILEAGVLTMTVLGGLIALLGAMKIAVLAARGDRLSALAPWVVTALVGILIVQPNWGVAIGLGAIATAMILRESLGRRGEPADKTGE